MAYIVSFNFTKFRLEVAVNRLVVGSNPTRGAIFFNHSSILLAPILAFCVVGACSLNSSTFDIGVMLAFGIVGYCFRKLDIPLAPLALTLIQGPLMERGLRQSLKCPTATL